jgi:NADPH:quinone reductase
VAVAAAIRFIRHTTPACHEHRRTINSSQGERTMKAIVLREIGGPEVLRFESVAVGEPGPDEVRLRHTAINVNFHDTYVRTGLYKTLALPGIPGLDAVGVVEAIGSQVKHLKLGDRVAYITRAYGAYSEQRLIVADRVLPVPEEIDDRTAAATLLRGLTVWMLLKKVHALAEGETYLVHAAAGGVGRLLCQWATHLGANVIGTAGNEQKAARARGSGCKEVILYRQENFAERVRELTKGRGVDAVFDSVGRDTFSGSLECLAVRGHLINFGQSSGPVEPFAVSRLADKSNTLSRPLLFHYIEDALERHEMAEQVFEALRSGVITADIGAQFPLRDAAQAHRAIELRATTGSTILIP